MSGTCARRYPLRTHESYGFWTGLTPDNKRVLTGLLCPNLIAFFFDADSALLAVEQRPLDFFQSRVLFIPLHFLRTHAFSDFRIKIRNEDPIMIYVRNNPFNLLFQLANVPWPVVLL